jgi:hypothetical protein
MSVASPSPGHQATRLGLGCTQLGVGENTGVAVGVRVEEGVRVGVAVEVRVGVGVLLGV